MHADCGGTATAIELRDERGKLWGVLYPGRARLEFRDGRASAVFDLAPLLRIRTDDGGG